MQPLTLMAFMFVIAAEQGHAVPLEPSDKVSVPLLTIKYTTNETKLPYTCEYSFSHNRAPSDPQTPAVYVCGDKAMTPNLDQNGNYKLFTDFLEDSFGHGSVSAHNSQLITEELGGEVIDSITKAKLDLDGDGKIERYLPFKVLVRTFISKRCEKNKESCDPINASTTVKIAGETLTSDYPGKGPGVPENPLKPKLGANTSLGFGESFSIGYSLLPTGVDNERMSIYDIFLSTKKTPNGLYSLVADVIFGPKPGQPWSYDVKLSYHDLLCSLSSDNPVCSDQFISAVEAGIVAGFEFDPMQDIFFSSNDIVLPDFNATYDGMFRGTPATLETTIGPLRSQDIEEVPGPLPVLGAASAFGYSRKLRKRIKISNLPVIRTIN